MPEDAADTEDDLALKGKVLTEASPNAWGTHGEGRGEAQHEGSTEERPKLPGKNSSKRREASGERNWKRSLKQKGSKIGSFS